MGHPARSPGFKKIQAEWYEKLRKGKFKDIEDYRTGGFEVDSRGREIQASHGGRPLKRWSGSSDELIQIIKSQEALTGLSTNFPEPKFYREEQFLHHPEFTQICRVLCQHRNSRVTYLELEQIWAWYIEGKSYRFIGNKFGINFSNVSRYVEKLIEWMNFLGNGGEVDQEERIVIRAYQETDAAFVFSSWRNAIWFDKKDRTEGAAENFYKSLTKRIMKMLRKPDATLRIACRSTDRDHIIGCALKIGACLEWVYVKKDYRGEGVGKLLAGEFTEISKPATRTGAAIAKKKGYKIKGEISHGQEKPGSTSDTTQRIDTGEPAKLAA